MYGDYDKMRKLAESGYVIDPQMLGDRCFSSICCGQRAAEQQNRCPVLIKCWRQTIRKSPKEKCLKGISCG